MILGLIVSALYITSEVMKEHRQMYGPPTQQEREWREAMNATNKNYEMRMKEIWGDKWREYIR